jgi:hypothetical protein
MSYFSSFLNPKMEKYIMTSLIPFSFQLTDRLLGLNLLLGILSKILQKYARRLISKMQFQVTKDQVYGKSF